MQVGVAVQAGGGSGLGVADSSTHLVKCFLAVEDGRELLRRVLLDNDAVELARLVRLLLVRLLLLRWGPHAVERWVRQLLLVGCTSVDAKRGYLLCILSAHVLDHPRGRQTRGLLCAVVFVGATRGDALARLAVRVVDDAPKAGLLRDRVLCLRVGIQGWGVRCSILTTLQMLIRHI